MTQAQLWERDAILTTASEHLERAMAGSGCMLAIEGEAGLGKTSILEATCARARAADVDVATARGEEMEAGLPFGLVDAALAATGRPGAPEPDDRAAPGAPRAHRTLRWLRQSLADHGPLVLALDDLHWADTESLRLLAFLAPRIAALPIVLVAAVRPWPPDARRLCRSLQEGGVATVGTLEPLSPSGSELLLAAQTGTVPTDETVALAHERCRGNPLLLTHFADALVHREDVPDAAHARGLPDEHQVLRFTGLDDDGRRWLRAASVLGSTFHLDVATEVARLDAAVADSVLDAVWRSGLLHEAPAGAVRFAHPLLADALGASLPLPLRQQLHARAFDALADRGSDSQAAGHAVPGVRVGHPRAVAVTYAAGRAALRAGAVNTATGHLEAAFVLSAEHPSAALMLDLAEALSAGGRMEDTAAACRRLLAGSEVPWTDQLAALRLLGRALSLTGERREAEAALTHAADLAVAHGEPARAVEPLLDLSLAAWLTEGPRRALPLAERARTLAHGAPRAVHELAEATWGHLALETGDPKGLDATERIGLDLAARSLDPGELVWPWAAAFHVAINENYAGHHDKAMATYRRAAAAIEDADADDALATVKIHLANIALRRGELDSAIADAGEAESLAAFTPSVVPYAALARAEALLWLGRLDDSEAACGAAHELAGDQWFAGLWLAHVRGLRELWQGDPRASVTFVDAERLVRESGVREPCQVLWSGHAITAHLTIDRVDDARRVVAWLEECAHPLPCVWPRAAATLGRAQIAAHEGREALAREAFDAALALHDEADLPLYRVEALLAYGGFLRRHRHPLAARPVLAEAVRIAEACDAGWLARTARAELGLAGGRRRRHPGTRDMLTAAERRVAARAASGDSNAAIARALHLSVNTVETHLKHVYAKLGIRSRRDLIADPTAVDLHH